jgi:ABC-2 type transport system ATP-binding protein
LSFAVEVRNIRKTYVSGWLHKRKKEALRGVTLAVPQGALWGILGPNGAGKTTFLSILSNLLRPDSGEVRVLGMDFQTRAMDIFQRINLSSGHANFLWSLSVRENLEYYAMLYGLSGKRRRQKVQELLALLDLTEFARVRFDELSTGTKQKLSLAKSLINEPQLLFLDEPTVGLDPDIARRIREFIQDLHQRQKTTILITTHNMQEAESLCEQLAFLKEGAVREFGSPPELKHKLQLGDTVRIQFNGSLPATIFDRMAGLYGVQLQNATCFLVVDDHRRRLPQILDILICNKIIFDDVSIRESDLEDVFIKLAR